MPRHRLAPGLLLATLLALLAPASAAPPLTKAGKTYTYFCRIHPFMRGSVRVKDKKRN